MKRILASTLLGAALTLSASVCLADTGVTSGNVFVRQSPSMGSRTIGSFKKGVTIVFTVVAENNKWAKVEYKGNEGYVGRKIINTLHTDHTPEVKHGAAEITVIMPMSAPVTNNPPAKGGPKAKATSAPGGKATQVFEIIQDVTAEELRLKTENTKLSGRVKDLENKVAEIQPLKDEIVKLKADVQTKDHRLDRFRAMFPYAEVIESLEDKGRDVLLTGIGKARMVELGKKVVIRLENENITSGERVLKSVAKERYQTGAGNATRVYYVLNNQSIKNTN